MKVAIRWLAVAAVMLIAVVGLTATESSALATHIPVGPGPSAVPIPLPPLQPGKGVSLDSNCAAGLVSGLGNPNGSTLYFVSGNAHVYGPTNHPLTNGANIEGDAYLFVVDAVSGNTYTYFGQGHAWFGQSNLPPPPGTVNPPPTGPGAQVQAETIQFHGSSTGSDESVGSIDVQGSGGATQSASGNLSGWGHAKVTC